MKPDVPRHIHLPATSTVAGPKVPDPNSPEALRKARIVALRKAASAGQLPSDNTHFYLPITTPFFELHSKTELGVAAAKSIPGPKLLTPKIPLHIFLQAVQFNLEGYAKIDSEVQITGFYHKETKEWILWPFEQTGIGLSTTETDSEANRAKKAELHANGYETHWVFTMHNHCDSSAFASGTDNADELRRPGLHVTVGNLKSKVHSLHVRVVAQWNARKDEENNILAPPGNMTWEPKWKDIIDFGPNQFYADRMPNEELQKVLGEKPAALMNGTPPSIPAEWLALVTKRVSVVTTDYRSGYGQSQMHYGTGYVNSNPVPRTLASSIRTLMDTLRGKKLVTNLQALSDNFAKLLAAAPNQSMQLPHLSVPCRATLNEIGLNNVTPWADILDSTVSGELDITSGKKANTFKACYFQDSTVPWTEYMGDTVLVNTADPSIPKEFTDQLGPHAVSDRLLMGIALLRLWAHMHASKKHLSKKAKKELRRTAGSPAWMRAHFATTEDDTMLVALHLVMQYAYKPAHPLTVRGEKSMDEFKADLLKAYEAFWNHRVVLTDASPVHQIHIVEAWLSLVTNDPWARYDAETDEAALWPSTFLAVVCEYATMSTELIFGASFPAIPPPFANRQSMCTFFPGTSLVGASIALPLLSQPGDLPIAFTTRHAATSPGRDQWTQALFTAFPPLPPPKLPAPTPGTTKPADTAGNLLPERHQILLMGNDKGDQFMLVTLMPHSPPTAPKYRADVLPTRAIMTLSAHEIGQFMGAASKTVLYPSRSAYLQGLNTIHADTALMAMLRGKAVVYPINEFP